MSADPFDGALSDIFARSEAALAEQLGKVKARAESLQAEDTSRLAFTLTEAIEHALEPAVAEALDRYD
jgi:acyl transferase domain-containing protein